MLKRVSAINKCLHCLPVIVIIISMKLKHRKTLIAVFSDPVNGNMEWGKIESLLRAIGCCVIEGAGSSVTFEKNGIRAYFHRPHPAKEALIYRMKATREFLMKLGEKP